MKYRRIANTDLEVSTVCFGCWAIVGGFNWGQQDEQDSLAALQAAYDAGITFFDTAEAYGNGRSEQMIAKALGGVRENILIASKVAPPNMGRGDLTEACERSLRNLGTDRIDLYQLHWPSTKVPLEESVAELEALKSQGKIREYGVSNFGTGDLNALLRVTGDAVSNQLCYNLLFRAIEYEILPVCGEHSMSVLCYSPLMQGLLTGKFATADDVPVDRARTRHFAPSRPEASHDETGCEAEMFAAINRLREIADGANTSMANLAMAWLLEQPGVATVIAGGRNAHQAARNAEAADVTLSEDICREVEKATVTVKRALGPNADMWKSTPRIH